MTTAPSTLSLDTELRAGLAAEEALQRARSALRVGDVGARVAAFYLADLVDRKGYVELGHPTLKHFAQHRLRRPESTVRNLLTMGRALRELPDIDAAHAADRITWSDVRLLVPIATPETDRAWAEWTAAHTTSELRRQVARREKGDLPTAPERRRIHVPRQHAGADLSPTHYEVWRRAREKLEAECGGRLSDLDMMMEVAQWILRMRPDGTIPGWTPVNDRHFLLHVWPRGEGAQGGSQPVTVGEDGEDVPIDVAELTARLDRSTVTPVLVPSRSADEAELAALDPQNHGPVVPEELRDVATSAAMREQVLARDGYRCRSCGSRENLTVHHRVWRSYGGKTTLSNLLTACEACHSLVHARLLIVLGEPEGELRFLDRKGRPYESAPPQPVELAMTAAPHHGPELVELERLPAEVDSDWWERNAHLLSWSERQGELVLTPGYAREVERSCAAPSLVAARPGGPRLSSLVGQQGIRERLSVAIAAARQRGEPLGHLLLGGSPGLGKTTFARAVAAELAAPLTQLPAPHVRTPDALVRALVGVPHGGVLFLDEVHALPARAAEVLYEALDGGTLSLPVREGLCARTLRLRLRPFTLIGATTDPDLLPGPLLGRLRALRLEPYSVAELTTILCRTASERGLELTPDAAGRLARASRDTPRRALSLLQAVRDEAAAAGEAIADLRLVDQALAREGVDATGLDGVEREYLRELRRAARPLGLRTLAARLDVSERALRTIHEPLLLRRRLVRITPAGRTLDTAPRVSADPSGSAALDLEAPAA